jgi:integrase
MSETPLSSMPFSSASAFWFEQHSRYIKPNSAKNYAGALKVLRLFFGEILLRDITIADIRRYQDERRKKAGARLLNGEMSVLQMILKEARLWKAIEDDYRPLPISRRGAGHSLNKEDEERLRAVAFSRPKWRLAAHCMTIMLSTTMGFGELRQLRRRDVDMQQRCVTVREGAKNETRERTIPLNATAFESMTWILERWKKLGGGSDEHYILPHRPRTRSSHSRTKTQWILDEPMTAITSAFRQIRVAAGLPAFRIYDCRVQAITKLLSNPMVSTQVSKEIAGHISQAMQNRYSIQRFETKKAALDALENPSGPPPEKPATTMHPAAQQAASAGPIQPAIQAEIDRLRAEIARLADRQFDLALREHPPAPNAPEKPTRPTRRRKSDSGDPTEVIFHLRRSAKNLIAFPIRSA